MPILTKSLHSPIEPRRDGLRILASRFRGHGTLKSSYDIWMPNLGPSEKLLRSFLAEKITWKQFSQRYQKDLFESGSADANNQTIKNHGQKFTLRLLQHIAKNTPITLLCQCAEDDHECHRFLLQKILQRTV